MPDYSENLRLAHGFLSTVLQTLIPLASRDPSSDIFSFIPPILDHNGPGYWRGEEVMGFKRFIDSLEAHYAVLTKLVKEGKSPKEDPLPNVLNIVTFTKALLTAPPPIVAVRLTLSTAIETGYPAGCQKRNKGKGREKDPGAGKEGGYVDIIARGGMEWIRIWSKKEANLINEFREQDSYCNSDYEDDSEDEDPGAEGVKDGPEDLHVNDLSNGNSTRNGHNSPPASNGNVRSSKSTSTPPAKPALTNSLLTCVDTLLYLANTCTRPPGRPVPKLTLRLTRMVEHPIGGYKDERIGLTFDAIRAKGVNLIFGDLISDDPTHPTTTLVSPGHLNISIPTSSSLKLTQPIRPSLHVNLDPTALIGLCSDLLHHPLPASEQQAKARFFRPEEFLIPGREGRQREGEEGLGQSQNSKELVKGVLDEMDRPLIAVIRDTIQGVLDDEAGCQGGSGHYSTGHGNGNSNREKTGVHFWATREAAQHAREALGSEDLVGDGLEQRRMRRLLGDDDGDFFEGSRFAGQEGCLKGLRVKIFDDAASLLKPDIHQDQGYEVRNALPLPGLGPGTNSFHHSLSALTSQFLAEYHAHILDPSGPTDLPPFLQAKRVTMAKIANTSMPFTIVSLGSFHHGAAQGMTTLSMGNVLFRECWAQNRWKPRGWAQGDYEREPIPISNPDGGRDAHGETLDGAHYRTAVLWLLPYRTLGEGKRVKFAKGDYSYPAT